MKKFLNILKNIITWVLILVTVAVMLFTVISVTLFGKAERSFFGYRAYIVVSDSMRATHFDAGDLIFVKHVPAEELQAGDVIAFTSINPTSYGETVTHMIREVVPQEDGQPGFVTYGTTTGVNDETVVTAVHVQGKYIGKIEKAGSFFQFLKTIKGYFLCIFLPFMLLIAFQIISCVQAFRNHKKEQDAKMQEQRDALQAERQKLEDAMAELRAMKEQLAAAAAEPPAEEAAPAEEPETVTAE